MLVWYAMNFVGLLLMPVVSWGLATGAFFAAMVLLNGYDNEHQVLPELPLWRLAVMGFLDACGMVLVLAGLNQIFAYIASSVAVPAAPWLRLTLWVAFVVSAAVLGTAVKTLIVTGYVPCRLGRGLLVGSAWMVSESMMLWFPMCVLTAWH